MLDDLEVASGPAYFRTTPVVRQCSISALQHGSRTDLHFHRSIGDLRPKTERDQPRPCGRHARTDLTDARDMLDEELGSYISCNR
jgi:hypothetical protein